MNKQIVSFLILAAWVHIACADDYAEFKTDELSCIIGSNTEMGEHRQGYNGLFHLTSVHQPEPLFVPAYAGLNLEHYFDGSAKGKNSDVFFEPRRVPMAFEKIDEHTALLRQSTTPTWKVESTTRFTLREPNAIDVRFECTPTADAFEGGAMGVFWASYINAPENKSLYFLTDGSSLASPFWMQYCTQFHNHDSTVVSPNDSFTWTFANDAPDALYRRVSQKRYTEPFYYGRFHNMVWIVMFKQPERGLVRFAHSPSGGGATKDKTDSNPAWDFQFIVPDYKVGETYTLEYRAVYKLWEGREDVLKAVREFRGQ